MIAGFWISFSYPGVGWSGREGGEGPLHPRDFAPPPMVARWVDGPPFLESHEQSQGWWIFLH